MNENHLLDALAREGVLLSVSVRFWRAAKKLKAEDWSFLKGVLAILLWPYYLGQAFGG